MKLRQVTIHNFRSIADQDIRVEDYSLLIGANNSGKSNFLDALRVFYEKDLKFGFDRDFPKFPTADQESWMEIEFELAPEEVETIRAEYLLNANRFRVRKWLFPPEKAKEGLFGYEGGKLSGSLFYGWKNVSQGKLGDIIYIPAVSYLEEHTKLSGPSALRDLVNDILKQIVTSSKAFDKLAKEFGTFGATIKQETTEDKRSLAGLEKQINAEISHWGMEFTLCVDSPREEDIVRSLIRHTVTDRELKQAMNPECFGHGFQRHLIFTLLRVSASYTSPKPAPKKKDLSPELTLLLFEEPEAFLHPPQQQVLSSNLGLFGADSGRQVVIATHSPLFVSYSTDDIANLVKFAKVGVQTQTSQIDHERLGGVFQSNKVIETVVAKAKGEDLETVQEDSERELEAVRHFLWLNPERSGLFFADFILIVEGLSEQVVTNYLLKSGRIKTGSKSVYVLDALGKYNIVRFVNLAGALQIPHAVLHDLDTTRKLKEKAAQDALNELIDTSRNEYTRAIDTLPEDLETFLGLDMLRGDRWKASRVLLALKAGGIEPKKLERLVDKLQMLAATAG